MIQAAGFGFATGFSLILAIGAQNAFVLRQGLLKAHVFWLCLLCALCDAILIAAGVLGFSGLVTILPWFPTAMALAGAAFLLVYGWTRFAAARKGDYDMTIAGQSGSLKATLLTGAAFTWLNPHVYLDTVALMGGISTTFETSQLKAAFAGGGMAASFVFFFSLGYGARFLAPIMQSAQAWRRLDILIGAVMWALAAKLLLDVFY